MNYNEFCKELRNVVLSNGAWGISEDNYRFLKKGYIAANDTEKIIIEDANAKYFNRSSAELLDDFVMIYTHDNEMTAGICKFLAKDLYDEFCENGWENVIDNINCSIMYGKSVNTESIINSIHDYDAIKDRLIIRPINYTDNKYALKDAIYKLHGDIALVLHMIYADSEPFGLQTIRIYKNMTGDWGKDLDEVWEDALINTSKKYPVRVYTKMFAITDPKNAKDIFAEEFNEKVSKSNVPLVTTTREINGAAAMFYSGVKEKLAEMIGGSYYVAFTSLHEARIHSVDNFTARRVLFLLKGNNQDFPNDLLSRRVFKYDAYKKTFEQLNL